MRMLHWFAFIVRIHLDTGAVLLYPTFTKKRRGSCGEKTKDAESVSAVLVSVLGRLEG